MLAVAAATSAAAQDTGWYGALDIGYHRTETQTLHSSGTPYVPTIGHSDSWVGFARVGYKLSPNLRLELEGGYRPGDVGAICEPNFGCVGKGGSEHAWSLMSNLLVDLMPNSSFSPFIGGGLGVVRTSLSRSVDITPTATNGTLTVDDADTKFAWQGIAGVSFKASERLNVDVTYRYLGSQRENYAVTNSLSTSLCSRP